MSTGVGGMSERKRALLELLIRQERDGVDLDHRISRRLDAGPAPLSYAQQRLWLLEQLQPGTSIYTVRAAVRLGGPTDQAVLARSLDELARRHPSLRTTFAMLDGKPVQLVAPPRKVPLTVVDIDAPTQEQRDRLLWARANEEADHRFDLAVGPLFRATLLRDGSTDPVVLLTMHHIVADGWSIGILLRDLAAIHAAFSRGQPSPLPELAIQYVDYAAWQHRSSSSGALRDQLTYWTRQLDQLPPLELPWSAPRPAVPDLAGGREHVVLSEQATAALAELGRREGSTLFMTLIAAWQLVLGRLSGQDDFGIGTPIANRTRAETEGIVGFFLNTLVLRADLGGDPTVRELLARVRETTVQAFTHQDLPFERLLEALQPPRDPSRTPLFQVFLNLLNFADERLNQPVAFAEAPPAHEYAQFDLSIYAGVQEGRLQLQLVYRTDLYESVVARRILGCLRTVLEQLPVDLGRRVSAVPLLPPEELRGSVARRRVVRPDVSYERFDAAEVEQSVPARFAAQARRHPDRIAIETVTAAWTYRRLRRWVRRTASLIREIAPVDAGRVAVLCGHDAPMVVALLASLEAGLAYVPLDPAHPVDRLAELIADAQVGLVLTDPGNDSTARQLAGSLPVLIVDDADEFADADWADADWADVGQADAELDPGSAVSPDAIAYLLYTSGTTGRPKGVVQSHRNLLHHVRAYTNSLQLGPQDRLALLASYGFDAAVMDIYGALLNGAGLCLYDVRREGLLGVPRWLVDQRVTIYHSTPTVFRQVFGDAVRGDEVGELTGSALRMVVLGGEEVRAADRDLFAASTPADCLLVNGLGPTESTLALQLMLDHHTPVDGRTVPVGYAVEDTTVLVLNESGAEVEVYGVGRLVIESRHLALGYWRRPEQTRAVFRTSVTDPAARRYDTGDLCRRLPDGSIEYAGRRDRQLKIRGQRVEVGEVETHLVAHPTISDALVTVLDAPAASPELGPLLVGYVQCRPGCSVTSEELQAQLRRTLPVHMVPTAIVILAALPVTVNGKVDRRTLPLPDLSASAAGPLVAPRSGLERTLVGLFGSVLGRSEVGVTDDFFALGGHSLLATQLLSRVRSTLKVELPLRVMFEHPTVAALATVIEQQNPAPSTPLG